VISFKDLDAAVQLIAAFITSLEDDFDFSR